MLTVDELKSALPKNLQSNATQEFCDLINQISTDPEEAREVRENFVTYSSVMLEGKYKTEDYLNAVTYCTFKLMGLTNKLAYQKTFPKRYQNLVAAGRTEKEISAYVAAFHKNQLVNRILQQAMIPAYLINQDAFQKAINTQVLLMETAQSEMVRTTAANSLLVALKQPEVKKIEMEIGTKGGGLGELRDTIATLVQRQQELIAGGATARTIGRIPIGAGEDIIDVVPVHIPEPILKQPMPASVAALGEALQTGAVGVHVPMQEKFEPEKKEPAPMAHTPKMSLFDGPFAVPATAADIKGPAVNYARCCERAIEDCICVEVDHIYLPVSDDVPQLKRKSLFDDPADMP